MSKFALLFLLVFFGGIVAALMYSGTAAFVLYQLVYFLNPDDRWWSASIPGLRYSLISALLMMFALTLKYREYTALSPWLKMPAFKWMVLLVLMYYAVHLVAVNPALHDKFTFDFTKLIIIVLVAYKLVTTEKALDVCLSAYVVGCTYIGYLAHITGRNYQGRVEGIGLADAPDANDTAAALVPAAAILMYFAWVSNKKIKILVLVCGALIANGIVLINSRGSFLGIVASLIIFLFFMVFSRFQRPGQRSAAVFMILLALSGGLYVSDDLFWERMSTLQSEDRSESGASRTAFWVVTFDMMDDHPFGVGAFGYQALSPLYMDEETRGGLEHRAVHSLWFQGLSEVGWIGLVLFVAMLLSIYRLSSKAKRFVVEQGNNNAYFKILALECALFGYLVAGSFIDRFRAEILYWMILFLAVAINVFYLQKRHEDRDVNRGLGSRRISRDGYENE